MDCRAHELDNLYVVDTSFFPSIGAVNPALTAMANSLRVGDHLLERLTVGRAGCSAPQASSSRSQPETSGRSSSRSAAGSAPLRRRPRPPRRLRGRRDVHVGSWSGADAVAEPAGGRQRTSSAAAIPARTERAREPQRDPRSRPLGRWSAGEREPDRVVVEHVISSAAGLPVLARDQRSSICFQRMGYAT